MMRIRPSTRADFDALDAPTIYRMQSLTGVAEDGRILGVGGVARLDDGRLMAFADLTKEARKNPVALHKAAVLFMARLKAEGVRSVVALADMEETPAAERWLGRLGFEKREYSGAAVWVWEAK